MSTTQDQSTGRDQSNEPDRLRAPWLSIALTLTLSLLLLAAAGFLNGTMDGDIPWPATQAEETVYYSGRYLAWGGVALALVGAVTVAFVSKRRSMTAGLGWGWGILTFVTCGFVGAVVFFSSYAVGNEHFFYAFSA